MPEVKKCIKALAFYYLLMAISVFPGVGIIPMKFPTDSLPSLYLLTLSFCLIIYNYRRVTGPVSLRMAIHRVFLMIFLMFLFRGLKYTVFGNETAISRFMWYLYYLPMLCIPMILFFISLYICTGDEKKVRKKWGWVFLVTVALVALVLTNDLHQQVFIFQPEFADWNGNYSYGWGFPAINAWMYTLYTVAVTILVVKHPIKKVKRWSWLIAVPFVIGVTMLLLLMTGNVPKMFGWEIFNLHESLCFMVVGIMECAMQLGLIHVNNDYDRLFKISNVPVQITDPEGTVSYKSATASELSPQQQAAPDGTRIGEHTILHRLDFPNGYGFYEDDVTELDRLNEELEEANERLFEENELISLQNDLLEKKKALEQKNIIYDDIANHTKRQSEVIAGIAQKALDTKDIKKRDKYRKQIAMLGSYIKRYANLMILKAQSDTISAGEFGLAVSEGLRYLNLYGIPGEIVNNASGEITSDQALAVFEAFELLLERSFTEIKGVYANISAQDAGLVFKVNLENLLTDPSERVRESLLPYGIQTAFELEDNVGYFTFLLKKGGDAL